MAKKRSELYFKTYASELFDEVGVGSNDLVFEIVNPKYHDHKYIKGKYERTFNGKKYLLRYNSSFDSPFVDEQASDQPVLVKGITFSHRIKLAGKDDPCLQKFLLLHPGNVLQNGRLFELRDDNARREERLKDRRIRRQAMKLLDENMTLEALRPVAYVLNPTDISIAKRELKDIEELIELAIDSNPQEVVDAFNNEEAELIYHFNRAISEGIITINDKDRKVIWTEGGGKLFDVPPGLTAWRRWVGFAATKDGQLAHGLIKEQFNNDK